MKTVNVFARTSTAIGRSVIYQPKTQFCGGCIKWFDDSKLIKKEVSDMDRVTDWLFNHYGSPVYLVVKNDVVHTMMRITIDDVQISGDSVTVYSGDDTFRLSPTGAKVYENEGLYIESQSVTLMFIESEE